MKGIIALDIDGTLTTDMKPTPREVVSYLHKLVEAGWYIVFITGRTFHWGYEALKELDFPYFYAVQNGSVILKMPSKEVVSKKYLSRNILGTMEKICADEPTDCVVYTGFERSGYCYYRPKEMSHEIVDYLMRRKVSFRENWEAINSYDQMPLQEFPVVKCFGSKEVTERVSEKVYEALGLDAPVIRDPFDENFYLMQATCPGINKGQALLDLKELVPFEGIIIAAGDDNNDIPMLKKADIKVVMENAPENVRRMADIIAPPASEEGIIVGLNRALRLIP